MDEILNLLRQASEKFHAEFEANAGRTEQFDSHLATVIMVVEHANDERDRAAAEGTTSG